MRILLADDDFQLTQMLRVYLDQLYQVDIAGSGQEALSMAQQASYDLLVLDIHMPAPDGIAVCRSLRAENCQTPILLMTASDSTRQRIGGLNAGADDYVSKPLNLEELLARMNALLRRGRVASSAVLYLRGLRIDMLQHSASFRDQPISLSAREYALLELFMRHPGRVFSRAELLSRLWGWDKQPMEDSVKAHIKGLRHKLSCAGINDLIENIYGIGYRLSPEPATNGFASSAKPIEQVEHQLTKIWQDYSPLMQQRLGILTDALQAIQQQQLAEPLRQQAIAAAHHLAGVLGIFKRDAGTEPAKRLEQALTQSNFSDLPSLVADLAQLQQLLGSGINLPGTNKPDEHLRTRVMSKLEQRLGHDISVLALDDDPMILAATKTLLSPWGMRVTGISSAADLATHLQQAPPDVLLMDVELPHENGIALCENIRSEWRWVSLPIVFMTRHTDAATLAQLFEAGADDYIAKPLRADELASRILNSLDKARLLRELATRDHTTGLLNLEASTQEIDQAMAEDPHTPLTFIVLSIANLSAIRREHGQDHAHQILRRIGSWIRHLLPNQVIAGYWDAGEFILAFPRMRSTEAQQQIAVLAHRLRTEIFRFENDAPILAETALHVAESSTRLCNTNSLYHAAFRVDTR